MDEGTREEKAGSDQGDEEEKTGEATGGERGRRWGVISDVDLFEAHRLPGGYERAIRDAFVFAFRGLANKVDLTDEHGTYHYVLPQTIRVTIDQSQTGFIRFTFTCTPAGEDGGVGDAREN